MDTLRTTLLDSDAGKAWERIGVQGHHGINLPLPSLRSKNSCGIGEFFDLLPLIDWCKELKLDVIQLLPLNDTGSDPSPYNAVSSCALNPLYLSLHALPYLNEPLKKKIREIKVLNDEQRLVYHEVQSHKMSWLIDYFNVASLEILKTTQFLLFVEENPWLVTYGLFKVLKDKLGQNPWTTWPKELKSPTKREYDQLVETHWNDISFYIFLQFLCFQQLKEVHEYALKNGVSLMGDIPILLSPDSADVWGHPESFDLSLTAGAPPDTYNKEGQHWGFPLYDWKTIKRLDYSWWKQRVGYASYFYDIYRIDHVIGFFRIWAIPPNRPAIEGKFIPEEEALWAPQGKEILEELLAVSPMLPIAEDLGVVPPVVGPILKELGICGTKVMRWERNWKQENHLYIPLNHYPPISLTTLSTHDSETLDQWWSLYPDEAKPFAMNKGWTYTPTLTPEQRQQILWDSHHTSSLFHINLLQEYLRLFPELCSENTDDDRINIPGTILAVNWTFRFHVPIEEITSHEGLKKAMSLVVF